MKTFLFLFFFLFSNVLADSTTTIAISDTELRQSSATTNYGSATTLLVGDSANGNQRSILTFTLPNISGTITNIKLHVVFSSTLTKSMNAHLLTRNNWVENQATWNIYSTGNNWTSSGGDYSTLIGNTSSISNTDTIFDFGTSTNSSFNDRLDILLKLNTESSSGWSLPFNSVENSTGKPYLEITYTPSSGGGGGTSTPDFGNYATTTGLSSGDTTITFQLAVIIFILFLMVVGMFYNNLNKRQSWR
jgi:hypothetical protein